MKIYELKAGNLITKGILYLFLINFIAFESQGQITHVWALGDGEKIFRDELNHPLKDENYTWNGGAIRLKGLFNEVMAFQVIVESGSMGAEDVELVVNCPVHQTSGKVIGGNTQKYGPGGTVEIFTQHYLHVENPTEPLWFYGSRSAAPEKMTGWIPDALIPVNALPGRGGFPVDILPSQNQGFWIDISLPRDQEKFPEGLYTGSVQVLQKGKVVETIPIEITLLPHYLPDESHTHVWMFTGNIDAYYPGVPELQLEKMIKFEGRRHRIGIEGGFKANGSPFDSTLMNSYLPYLDGLAYTPENGYHGNGVGVGEKLFPIGMYGSDVMGNTKNEVQHQSDLWVNWFTENAPDVTYFWYATDEPPRSRYSWLQERGEWIHENPGPGKNLPVFTTTGYQKVLDDAVDIWAGYDGVDLSVLPELRQNGDDHWFYNGNRPRYGSTILEAAAVDMRVNSWILYKYGINVHFIWEGTHWRHNHQGPKGHLHQNIYRNPLTFINDDMEFGNGDGVFFYPGRMPFYPQEDRGLNRIFTSIRMKNIRRGQQDANIMWLAEQKAGKEKVVNIIEEVVPKALSEVSMGSSVKWSVHGDDYDRVREELIKLLE